MYQAIKSKADIVIASLLLVLLAPVFLVLALLIACLNGRPIIFKQVRVGKDEKLFTIYKFCTMNHAKDASGNLLPDAQRLTLFGKLLRKTSLDELPQLINIVRGDMAFVGPRPLREAYLPLYSEEQRKRHNVKPGITGWAQVNGRNAISWERKFFLDVYYTHYASFRFDMKIIGMTIQKVLFAHGVSQEGHVTVERFQGNKQTM
ncbi:sugar transferase [Listeria booriae]|uniref:sugar transferase n=1 Tax=Listeria booriae TaxID=1552123 RepID=UPI0016267B34|nr:sugar transferase [Listeria booriae]MBC1558697.1 sugar transferase [Listeria booriae]